MQCPWPGLEPRQLDPETSTLTTGPPPPWISPFLPWIWGNELWFNFDKVTKHQVKYSFSNSDLHNWKAKSTLPEANSCGIRKYPVRSTSFPASRGLSRRDKLKREERDLSQMSFDLTVTKSQSTSLNTAFPTVIFTTEKLNLPKAKSYGIRSIQLKEVLASISNFLWGLVACSKLMGVRWQTDSLNSWACLWSLSKLSPVALFGIKHCFIWVHDKLARP